jgi:hypothetical protein
MMIARSVNVENAPDSYKSKFSKKPEGQDYLSEILPFSSGCLNTIGESRRAEKAMKQKLTPEELTDYRVPIPVFFESSKLLLRTKPALKPKILRALKIGESKKDSKIGWEDFLGINQILQFEKVAPEAFIEFFVRFFDPYLTGFVPADEFEELLDLMFDNGGAEGQK